MKLFKTIDDSGNALSDAEKANAKSKAEAVLARANDETEAICKKVRDAFKYSDPMSNEALCEVESEINGCFSAFKAAIREKNAAEAASMAEELLA